MTRIKIFAFLIFTGVIIFPLPVHADDEDSIENLGWLAVFCGVMGTLPFIIMMKLRRHTVTIGGSSVSIAKGVRTVYKPILNFHIMMNSIGYAMGMFHGLLLSKHLDSIALSLALVMTLMMTSGLMLKYTSSRNTKIFNRLLHGQSVLVILLIALIILHILTGND